jgi:hypothetical protein
MGWNKKRWGLKKAPWYKGKWGLVVKLSDPQALNALIDSNNGRIY